MQYKALLDKAIRLRESGNLSESSQKFNKLLDIANQIKHKDDRVEDYIQIMGEYVIQKRLEAKKLQESTLNLGKEIYNYALANSSTNPLAVRSVSNTLVDAGWYEEAINYLKKMVSITKDDPFRNADSRMHLAYAYYRTSQVKNFKKQLELSKHKLDQADPNTPHISVQICYWHLLKALYLSSSDVEQARTHANEALKLAKEGNYEFRKKQAELILGMLK